MSASNPLSHEELQALGTVTDIATAGRAFGLSRAVAYDLAQRGQFPCPVLRISSRRYRVPVSGILAALGVGTLPPAGG